MAAASQAMIARGQLEAGEAFARRGLELAGDLDSEGRRRCCIELADFDLYQGRLAEGAARYVSLAVPGWEAVTLDWLRCAPPIRGTSKTPANSTTERGPPQPARRCERSTITSRPRSTTWPVTGPPPCTITTSALCSAGRADTAIIQGVASVGLVAVQAASGQVREALAGYRDLDIDHWQRIGAWTQQWTTLRNAADLFDQLGDHELASFLATPPTAPPKPASPARRQADHKSLLPIRHPRTGQGTDVGQAGGSPRHHSEGHRSVADRHSPELNNQGTASSAALRAIRAH